MKVYGQVENAQLENLGADTTPGIVGRFYVNTVDKKSSYDDGVVIQKIVTEALAATLTNKTLTSPILTSPGFDVATMTEQAGAPANPGAGFRKFYVKTDGRLYTLDSGGSEFSISPLTTKGDIGVFSTTNDRLAVGLDGQILSADSAQATGLKWVTNAGAGPVFSATGQPCTGTLSGSFNDVIYGTTQLDTASGYNNLTGEYTVQAGMDGYYWATADFLINATVTPGDQSQGVILVNGAIVLNNIEKYSSNIGLQYNKVNGLIPVQLVAGDIVKVQSLTSVGGVPTYGATSGNNMFQLFFIRP